MRFVLLGELVPTRYNSTPYLPQSRRNLGGLCRPRNRSSWANDRSAAICAWLDDQLDFRRIFWLGSTQLNSGQLWSTRPTWPLHWPGGR